MQFAKYAAQFRKRAYTMQISSLNLTLTQDPIPVPNPNPNPSQIAQPIIHIA